MPDKIPTRQLILEAAVACIEKYGLSGVTTRKIATQAGTNIASINYYFRSKDVLIAETLSMTIRHMLQDVVESVEDPKQPFEVVLGNVIFYLLDGSLRFPGVSGAHLTQAILDRQRASVSARAMAQVFDSLVARAVRAYPRKDPDQLRLRMSQVMSSALFTMLAPGFFRTSPENRLNTSKHARTLAESYVSLFREAI